MHISELSRPDRLVNLFGALAVAARDRVGGAVDILAGGSASDAAALNLIGHAPELSIDDLAQGLALSHAATVRLVDRLAAAGLVERRDGKDRRTRALVLTAAGGRRRDRLQRRRLDGVATLLASLTPAERGALERITEKILVDQVHDLDAAMQVCRLCDERVCTGCPMERLAPPA